MYFSLDPRGQTPPAIPLKSHLTAHLATPSLCSDTTPDIDTSQAFLLNHPLLGRTHRKPSSFDDASFNRELNESQRWADTPFNDGHLRGLAACENETKEPSEPEELMRLPKQAGEPLPRPPSTGKVSVIAVVIQWLVLVGFLVTFLLDDPMQQSLRTARWALWGVLMFAVILESPWMQLAEWKWRWKKQTDNHSIKVIHHFEMRESMKDIVDTMPELIRRFLHLNSAKLWLEHTVKDFTSDGIADSLRADEVNMDWSKWPKIGDLLPPEKGKEKGERLAFGESMRTVYFMVGQHFLGSTFNSVVPETTRLIREEWDNLFQVDPAVFMFRTFRLRLKLARVKLAQFLSVDPDDLILLPNGMEAVSTVFRSLPWEVGDTLLYITPKGERLYENACRWVEKVHGVEVSILVLEMPMSKEDIVTAIHKHMVAIKWPDGKMNVADHGIPEPVVAIFEHITQNGWILPAKAMTEALHKHGTSVLIDGGQAPGQLDLNVGSILADWYVGSCTHWLYAPPGVGFMVANPLKHDCTVPLTVPYADAQCYDKGFAYYGLRDFSPWLCIIDSLSFVTEVCGGWENVRSYCRRQAMLASQVLKAKWGEIPMQGMRPTVGNRIVLAPGANGHPCVRFPTEKATIVKDDFSEKPYQVLSQRGVKMWFPASDIMLPDQRASPDFAAMPTIPLPKSDGASPEDAEYVMNHLESCGITARIVCSNVSGVSRLYAALTCQIWNSESDWVRLADAVLQLNGTYKKRYMM